MIKDLDKKKHLKLLVNRFKKDILRIHNELNK